jgi:hypothetical protein
MSNQLQALKQSYERNGFISGVRILRPAQAGQHRSAMENAESKTSQGRLFSLSWDMSRSNVCSVFTVVRSTPGICVRQTLANDA